MVQYYFLLDSNVFVGTLLYGTPLAYVRPVMCDTKFSITKQAVLWFCVL